MSEQKQEIALLAGGCFWGVQELIRALPGVISSDVGYTGGQSPNPSYKEICTGLTGHAEAVRIIFNPTIITFNEILKFFFRLHDPTTLNRQGNDVGSQYRSAIFYTNEAQKIIAEKVKSEIEQSGKWQKPLSTEITAAQTYYPAESYHQDYLQKNPDGYTCHYLRD